jgi:hypothetical protein
MVQPGYPKMMSLQRTSEVLTAHTVVRIRRLQYVFRGEVKVESGGPIELTLDNSEVVLLTVGHAGEAIDVRSEAWSDPFAPPLSKDNEDFVARSGKWTAFDVSDEVGFIAIVGTAARQVMEVRNPEGVVLGLELTFPKAVLRAEVAADALFVDIVA